MEKKVKNKGNAFWKQRSKHGKDKIFESPEILWQEACNYFQWCDSHPMGRNKLMRAYTLYGLCFYLNIGFTTWGLYKKRPEFQHMVEQIEMVVYNQKFTGAAAGIFNGNIISRDLGLIDKQEHSLDRKQYDLSVLNDQELQLYYDLQKKIDNGNSFTTGIIQTPKLQIHNGVERGESREAGGSVTKAN